MSVILYTFVSLTNHLVHLNFLCLEWKLSKDFAFGSTITTRLSAFLIFLRFLLIVYPFVLCHESKYELKVWPYMYWVQIILPILSNKTAKSAVFPKIIMSRYSTFSLPYFSKQTVNPAVWNAYQWINFSFGELSFEATNFWTDKSHSQMEATVKSFDALVFSKLDSSVSAFPSSLSSLPVKNLQNEVEEEVVHCCRKSWPSFKGSWNDATFLYSSHSAWSWRHQACLAWKPWQVPRRKLFTMRPLATNLRTSHSALNDRKKGAGLCQARKCCHVKRFDIKMNGTP